MSRLIRRAPGHRDRKTGRGEQSIVQSGIVLPPGRPAINVLELYSQHRRLDGIKAGIDAHQVVDVLLTRAVRAQCTESVRNVWVVGRKHATIAITTEILARKETEASNVAEAAAASSTVFGTDGLRGIIDEGHTLLASQMIEGG